MQDIDTAYQNGKFIAGADGFLPKWNRLAQEFRDDLGKRAELGLSYGPGRRHQFDLFRPESEAKGLLVFVHGGYWLNFDRETWSHLGAGAVARGWAVAMPSYTLAPEARISAMTVEVAQAVRAATALVAGPVVVTGHSAGGHLSARMGCADMDLPMVKRVVPLSPLAELEPLRQTAMNANLKLTEAEVAAESPARLPLRPGTSAHVWVGGQERPSFLWQARTLSEAWACDWTVTSGKHHLDVIDELTDASSGLMAACLDGI